MTARRILGIRDILAIVDVAGRQPAARLAAELAAAANAHLAGLVPAPTVAVAAVVGGAMAIDLMAELADQAEDSGTAALAAFETVARNAGLTPETGRYRFIDGDGVELVARARLADLVVVGQDDPDAPEPARLAVIEALLFDAGVPVLAVPYIFDGPFAPRRVAVAWDGSRPAARAVRAALPLMAAADTISVVVVDEGQREELGPDLAQHLARHGLAVTVRRAPSVDGDVGAALLNEAAEAGTELLVMGAYGHSRIRELVLGGATRTLMEQMTLPTLMAH